MKEEKTENEKGICLLEISLGANNTQKKSIEIWNGRNLETKVGGRQGPYLVMWEFQKERCMRTTVVNKKGQNEGLETHSQELWRASSIRGQGAHNHPERLVLCQPGQVTEMPHHKPHYRTAFPHNRCNPTQTREFGDKRDLNPWANPNLPPPPALLQPQEPGGTQGKSSMHSWERAFLICSIRNVTTSCLH